MNEVPVFLDAAAIERLRADAGVVAEVRTAAEAALRGPLFTVTGKTKVPPSGDVRDYMSLGPYWWPNPETADGLPYVRRDGKVNPESLHTDRQVMEAMVAAVRDLAAGWMLTKDRRYGERAAELLRVFFIDEKARMNPNLKFGQAIPGHCEGRGIGIIDTRILAGLLDYVRLLRDAETLDEAGLRGWFAEFNRWLLESPLGIAEANEHNNHGTWYDVQVTAFAVYCGEDAVAREVLERVGERRVRTQIAADGSQPHEIARTLGLSYSTMNLMAFFWLAQLGDRVGVNVWAADDGRIVKACEFLLPFWEEAGRWEGEQIKAFEPRGAMAILQLAAIVSGDAAYQRAAQQIGTSWRTAFQTV
jgi:hypothetical protein